MFGITAFAQAPFASLGGAFFGVASNDSTITLNAIESVVRDIPVTENLSTQTLSDIQTVTADFASSQTDTQTLTDSTAVLVAFLADYSDTQSLSEIQTAIRDTLVYESSAVQTLSDFQYARGWFNINDNQTVTWGAINNTQAPTWSSIDDTQNPNWINIDDDQ
jgi:hypothetical protein